MYLQNMRIGSLRSKPFLIVSLCAMILFGLMNVALPRAYAANDIYVSTTGNDMSGDGSPAKPYATIYRASLAAGPGYTVHVAVGNYTGSNFRTDTDGSATSRLRYVSDIAPNGARAKLIPPASNPNQVVWENQGDYVDIEGFEVVGTNSNTAVGLYTEGSYTVFKNNIVHDIATAAGSCTNQGGAGILTDWDHFGVNTDIIGNIVYNIGPAGCTSWIHGIYFATTGTVINNVVYNVSGGAVHLEHDARNVTIANNTLVGSGSGVIVAQGAGEHYHPCTGGNTTNCYSGPADYINVSNNIIYDNKDYGVLELNDTGTHNTYTYNLVYQSGTNWQLQNGLTHTHTVSAAPTFQNYAGKDFHLVLGSRGIDEGSSTYAPATDFDGVTRPKGLYDDIGAFEFVPVSTKTLTFWDMDDRGSGDPSGYWFKQALVNGTVVWEKDLTDPTDVSAGNWHQESVNITNYVTSPTFTLQFRLISKIGVGNYAVNVYWDDVAINGLTLTNPGMESTTGWTYAATNGNFAGGTDTVFHGGTKSYKLSLPANKTTSANQYSSISQTVSNP